MWLREAWETAWAGGDGVASAEAATRQMWAAGLDRPPGSGAL